MFRLVEAQAGFFDRAEVLGAVDRARVKVLSRFGAFVRTSARQSIRKRKTSAPPGSPPSSHTGLLKRFLFFSYDRDSQSVVVGPARLDSKKGDAPSLLEHGGSARRKRRRKTVVARYEPRPFMRPAYDKNRSQLGELWRNSVKG